MKYLWTSPDSVIESIVFAPLDSSKVNEAVIILNPNTTQQLELSDTLVDMGYSLSFDVVDEKPAIRVTGFKDIEKLLNPLKLIEAVKGEPVKESTAVKEVSYGDSIKKNSLRLAAGAYLFGNAAAFLSGFFRRDAAEMLTGAAFTVGDSTMLLFGHQSEREKHREVMLGFGEMMKKSGYMPSYGSAFSEIANNSDQPSAFAKLKRKMFSKVIAIKSVSEVIAGTAFTAAGINQGNYMKAGAGAAIGSGFAFGGLTSEKSNAQLREKFNVTSNEELDQKIAQLPLLERFSIKVQRNTLMVPGGMAGLNNALTFGGALKERSFVKNNENKTRKWFDLDNLLNGKDGLGAELNNLNNNKSSLNEYKRTELQGKINKTQKSLDGLANPRSFLGRKVEQKDFWKLNAAQSVFFGAANILYAITPKSGKGNKLLQDRFLASAASEIISSDLQYLPELVNMASHFASTVPELDLNLEEARLAILKKVAQLEKAHNIAGVDIEFAANVTEPEKTHDAQLSSAAPQFNNAAQASPANDTVTQSFANAHHSNNVSHANRFQSSRYNSPEVQQQSWEEKQRSRGNEYNHTEGRESENSGNVGISM